MRAVLRVLAVFSSLAALAVPLVGYILLLTPAPLEYAVLRLQKTYPGLLACKSIKGNFVSGFFLSQVNVKSPGINFSAAELSLRYDADEFLKRKFNFGKLKVLNAQLSLESKVLAALPQWLQTPPQLNGRAVASRNSPHAFLLSEAIITNLKILEKAPSGAESIWLDVPLTKMSALEFRENDQHIPSLSMGGFEANSSKVDFRASALRVDGTLSVTWMDTATLRIHHDVLSKNLSKDIDVSLKGSIKRGVPELLLSALEGNISIKSQPSGYDVRVEHLNSAGISEKLLPVEKMNFQLSLPKSLSMTDILAATPQNLSFSLFGKQFLAESNSASQCFQKSTLGKGELRVSTPCRLSGWFFDSLNTGGQKIISFEQAPFLNLDEALAQLLSSKKMSELNPAEKQLLEKNKKFFDASKKAFMASNSGSSKKRSPAANARRHKKAL